MGCKSEVESTVVSASLYAVTACSHSYVTSGCVGALARIVAMESRAGDPIFEGRAALGVVGRYLNTFVEKHQEMTLTSVDYAWGAGLFYAG